MEVLEEEEIKEMKRQQRHFEELRNNELMEVQRLEDAEIRQNEEKNRRLQQEKERLQLTKTCQKKLVSRVFAKEYLRNLEQNILQDLCKRQIFRSSRDTQFYYNLHPTILNETEKLIEDFSTISTKIEQTLKTNWKVKQKEKHIESILKEKKRRSDLLLKKAEDERRKVEEKERRRLERIQKKKEEELEELKKKIFNELIINAEYVEDIIEVSDSTGFIQNDKKIRK